MQELADNHPAFDGMQDKLSDAVNTMDADQADEVADKLRALRFRAEQSLRQLPSEAGRGHAIENSIRKRRKSLTEAAKYLQVEILVRALGLTKDQAKTALINIRQMQLANQMQDGEFPKG